MWDFGLLMSLMKILKMKILQFFVIIITNICFYTSKKIINSYIIIIEFYFSEGVQIVKFGHHK